MTQINIRIWKSLGKRFSTATRNAFLRRDAFLADVLQHELPAIDEELAGLINSEPARRFIAQQLELTSKEGVTLALPEGIVTSVRDVCEKHNLVRDALFNRLFFFLSYSPDAVAALFSMSEDALQAIVGDEVAQKDGNPTSFHYDWIHPKAFRSSTPLQLARQLVMSPFDPYRALLDVLQDVNLALADNDPLDWKDTTFSSLSFCSLADSKRKPHLAGLNLYTPDDETPGTDAYRARQTRKQSELDEMLREIDDL